MSRRWWWWLVALVGVVVGCMIRMLLLLSKKRAHKCEPSVVVAEGVRFLLSGAGDVLGAQFLDAPEEAAYVVFLYI
jgi:hypothetical protein